MMAIKPGTIRRHPPPLSFLSFFSRFSFRYNGDTTTGRSFALPESGLLASTEDIR